MEYEKHKKWSELSLSEQYTLARHNLVLAVEANDMKGVMRWASILRKVAQKADTRHAGLPVIE